VEGDLPDICAVYAHYVATSTATFDLEAPSLPAWGERLRAARLAGRPWRVAEAGGAFAGYATASEFRPRLAYRSTVETTVYLRSGLERRGVGRALYGELLRAAGDAGFRMAIALIPLPNAASVGLHEALGFEAVGVMREVGYKLGAWRDVGTWQLRLSELRHPGAG
jgi:phosphinothricin acetyltransferase